MHVGTGDAQGHSGAKSQDCELNLASIIDCLTVLITFMLASTSFLSIGILDAGVAAAGKNASKATPPPVNVTIRLERSHEIRIQLSGKTSRTESVHESEGKWNYEELGRKLGSIHSTWPSVNGAILTADDAIAYNDVIQAMDVTRKTLPAVMLGGF